MGLGCIALIAVLAPTAGLAAQAATPATPTATTAPADNPVHEQFVRYQKDLSQADRGAWVTALMPQIGIGTEAKEEAQFWYGLNAQKLDNARWQQLGREALAKLAKDGKTVWQTRARNMLLEAQLMTAAPDRAALAAAKVQLDQELGRVDKSPGAVETAVTLAHLCRYLNDTDTAQRAAKYALDVAKYLGYQGLYSADDLAELKRADRDANQAAKTPDAQREFDLAEQLMQDSKYDQAIDSYNRIIKNYPNDLLARKSELRVCQCMYYQENFLPAQVQLLKYIEADPKGPYRGQMHLLMGDIYLEHDFRLERAKREYAAVFHPDDYTNDPKKIDAAEQAAERNDRATIAQRSRDARAHC
ncbi:MAG: hypothetical protein ACREJ2_05850 [Planctomycetota bacterium]